ncbi:hypothetical protein FGD71_027135 [Streptomyces sporangiiformans]|uniref:Uncharacterized protein n=1 Tax=Streptomyces sporangiiformans TaxID=2315329 RepID=A0A505DF55_9ACTN|nr:hypothetical protein FGD71_027135 [Streptomyces sporangiiformans]
MWPSKWSPTRARRPLRAPNGAAWPGCWPDIGGHGSFGLYGEDPTYWWITDGTTSRDKTSFTSTGFAPPGS